MANEVAETKGSSATENEAERRESARLSAMESHGYTLGKVIGTGTYATVRVANSLRHKDPVAIKIVAKLRAPKEYLVRFLPREVEVVKNLKHPNIIQYINAIETTRTVYIIMEYAENGTLLDFIKKDSHIEERPRAKKWFGQLRDAVNYCHDEGVVHRDIKCENLLMDKYNDLKLTDFGFARGHMKPKGGGIPVLSETFCGSFAYASPEILKGVAYDPMYSDVWSMGVVLFAMVFGRLPFDDNNYKGLLKQVQSKIKFPLEPVVSVQCKVLIDKMLSPIKIRPTAKNIKKDPWVLQEEE